MPLILNYVFLGISIVTLTGMILLFLSGSFSYIYGSLYTLVGIAYLKKVLKKEIIELSKTTLTIHQKNYL